MRSVGEGKAAASRPHSKVLRTFSCTVARRRLLPLSAPDSCGPWARAKRQLRDRTPKCFAHFHAQLRAEGCCRFPPLIHAVRGQGAKRQLRDRTPKCFAHFHAPWRAEGSCGSVVKSFLGSCAVRRFATSYRRLHPHPRNLHRSPRNLHRLPQNRLHPTRRRGVRRLPSREKSTRMDRDT